MNEASHFSCVLVGEGTLLIQCANLLRERKHLIHAVVSSDASVQTWAEGAGISSIRHWPDLLTFATTQPFDILFSIVNYQVLPKEVLALPKWLAINYHDSLLPKYAGSYATSWSICGQETVHGITWHVMSEQVDAGPVLKQRSFVLTSEDTAFTANAKCYTAAISAFAELIDELSCGQCNPRPQQGPERSFFARRRRPPEGCLLQWDQSAERVSSLFRALDFGPYPNPLGLPKVLLGREFWLVTKLDILSTRCSKPAGQIARISRDDLIVATSSLDIKLGALASVDGRLVTIPELTQRYRLHEGFRFPKMEEGERCRLEKCHSLTSAHENFWVGRLAGLEPVCLPSNVKPSTFQPGAKHDELTISVESEIAEILIRYSSACSGDDLIFVEIVRFLLLRAGLRAGHIGFLDDHWRNDFEGLEPFFAAFVPFHVELPPSHTLSESMPPLLVELAKVKSRLTYPRDIVMRYPSLRPLPHLRRESSFPIHVARVRSLDHCYVSPDSVVTIAIAPEGTALKWICDSNKIDPDELRSLAHEFLSMLRAEGRPGGQRLEAGLTPGTRGEDTFIKPIDGSRLTQSREECLHHLFEKQVDATPDRVAVISANGRLTYSELNAQANRLACHIRTLGVRCETRVALCMDRSIEMLIGVLGILKAGGAYVPLDPAYPPERLAFMLRDSQPAVLLTQRGWLNSVMSGSYKVVWFDLEWLASNSAIYSNPVNQVSPANMAYVLYTSGSTGTPKGIVIEHRNAVAFLEWARSAFYPEELAGVCASTSLCFDLSIFELFAPLAAGGAVVLTKNALHLAPFKSTGEVSLINTVPSALDEVLRMGDLPSSVRAVNVAGEPLSGALARAVLGVNQVKRFFNLYGPTETTTYSTCSEVGQDDAASPPIGKPIANTEVFVLDEDFEPVSGRMRGQLFIAGAGVARGYLGRPDLTAERFTPHRFSAIAGLRMYKSGDAVCWRSDGRLEFLGRLDQQVKVHGFRIEPGEIEAALYRLCAVQKAVVVAREDRPGEKRLVAYVVGREGQSIQDSNLRDYLRQSLPEYMVPSQVVMMDRFPLTPNGKLDRSALPLPEGNSCRAAIAFVAPRTEIEESIVDTWNELLGVRRVSIHDNFFDLGGDSLLATRVVSRLRATLDVEVELYDVFAAPTAAGLANLIKARNSPRRGPRPT